jgi:hypothetical protein
MWTVSKRFKNLQVPSFVFFSKSRLCFLDLTVFKGYLVIVLFMSITVFGHS